MTKTSDYYQAGHILKTHGVKGEVILALHEPALFGDYSFDVIFIDPGGGLVPFFISSFSFNESKNILILKLEGIDKPDAASAFIQQSVFLDPASLPKPNGARFFIHEVIGFTIHDTNHGELGPVEEVLDLPMQQVFRILKGECEILIPAVESIILSIDREARTVQIKAPEGLIDLYLNEGDDDLEPDIEEENS